MPLHKTAKRSSLSVRTCRRLFTNLQRMHATRPLPKVSGTLAWRSTISVMRRGRRELLATGVGLGPPPSDPPQRRRALQALHAHHPGDVRRGPARRGPARRRCLPVHRSAGLVRPPHVACGPAAPARHGGAEGGRRLAAREGRRSGVGDCVVRAVSGGSPVLEPAHQPASGDSPQVLSKDSLLL